MSFLKWQIFVTIMFSVVLCRGTVVDDDLSLTSSQKEILDQFKEAVSNKVPHNHMKQDVYLIRWLRAKNFNLNEAQDLLMKNLKWREINKMDNILDEDWSDMEQDYPFRLDNRDKEGKPVFIGEFGHWDLRNADITGRFQRLKRYGERIMEEEDTLVRSLQSEGKLVTRVILIIDMDGFNLAQHMCGRCITFLLDFYQSFENHYPGLIDKLFVINNFPIVNVMIQPLLQSFSPNTATKVHLFNRNQNEYSRALLKYIDHDQLPERYGGTKTF